MTNKELVDLSRRVVTSKDAKSKTVMAPIPGGPTGPVPLDTYISKLYKYIPSEIIAVYIFIQGILDSLQAGALMQWGIFSLLLILTPLYMWRVTSDKAKSPAWAQIIIAFFSFAVWVFAVGGPFASFSWYNPLYGSILVALYTLVVPMIKN